MTISDNIEKECLCLKKRKNKKKIVASEEDKAEKYYCSVCGREINKEEYEAFEEMCWECWDDQLTEESEMMFGDVM